MTPCVEFGALDDNINGEMNNISGKQIAKLSIKKLDKKKVGLFEICDGNNGRLQGK